jgi:hypothetical protein
MRLLKVQRILSPAVRWTAQCRVRAGRDDRVNDRYSLEAAVRLLDAATLSNPPHC